MADLAAVIRFRKHTVDEKQRVLAQLYREQENIEKQKKVVEDQMAREIALGEEMGTTAEQAGLGLYLEGARKKIAALEKSIRAMDARIQRAQDDIRESFAEMKKVEITQAARDKRDEAKQKKKEENEFDDIAIDRFTRREDKDA